MAIPLSRSRFWPRTAQCSLLVVGFLGAVFYPGADRAAVLVPIYGAPPAAAIAWGQDHGAALVGLTRDGRAAILHLPSAGSGLTALRHGYLPIAADAGICTGISGNKDTVV